MFYVADDADDLTHFLAALIGGKSRFDSFADHVLSRIELVSETLVHDYDRRRIVSIVLVESAPCANRNSHRLEIIGGNDSHWGAVPLAFWQRMFFHVETCHHVAAAERKRNDRAGRGHSRQGPDPRQELIKKTDDVFVLRVSGSRQLNPGGEKAFGLETGRHATEPGETLDQQPGAHEQDQSKRYLRHDQNIAQTMFVLAAGPYASA